MFSMVKGTDHATKNNYYAGLDDLDSWTGGLILDSQIINHFIGHLYPIKNVKLAPPHVTFFFLNEYINL